MLAHLKILKLAPTVDVYLARICPRHLVEEEKHLKMSQAEKTFINSLLKVIWVLLNHFRVFTQPSSQASCTDGDIGDAKGMQEI